MGSLVCCPRRIWPVLCWFTFLSTFFKQYVSSFFDHFCTQSSGFNVQFKLFPFFLFSFIRLLYSMFTSFSSATLLLLHLPHGIIVKGTAFPLAAAAAARMRADSASLLNASPFLLMQLPGMHAEKEAPRLLAAGPHAIKVPATGARDTGSIYLTPYKT